MEIDEQPLQRFGHLGGVWCLEQNRDVIGTGGTDVTWELKETTEDPEGILRTYLQGERQNGQCQNLTASRILYLRSNTSTNLPKPSSKPAFDSKPNRQSPSAPTDSKNRGYSDIPGLSHG
jgi:hypothetical protein